MAKKSKNKNLFTFKDIFKANIYFKISDTFISLIIIINILLTYFGYSLINKSKKKELDNKDNENLYKIRIIKYVGYVLMIVFGMISLFFLIPIILHFFTFFLIDYSINEAFSD